MRLSTPRAYSLLALLVLLVVAVPTLVASYRHASDVVRGVGDPTMAPWLPASMVGLLVASLGVVWLRRRGDQPVGAGPWAACGLAMLMIVGANLAAVDRGSLSAYAVALFPPIALAITLELAAAVALRRVRHHSHGQAGPPTTDVVERGPDTVEDKPRDRHPVAPDHTPEQVGSADDHSGPEPGTDRDAVLPPVGSQRRDPPQQLSPAPGEDGPKVAGTDDAASQDEARSSRTAEPSTAPDKAPAAEADPVESVAGTAHPDVAQPPDQTAAAVGTPGPVDQRTVVPPPPSPSPARPARAAAKPPARGKRTTTPRPTSPPASATTDVPGRASPRTRPVRAAQPASTTVAVEPQPREEPASPE